MFFFQFGCAVTASTIVSGALAERCRFEAYFIYSIFITGFIYPLPAHWAWSENGWLRTRSPWPNVTFIDLAGSGVVHLSGGTAALMGAIFIGPRIGRFNDSRRAVRKRGYHIPGHSVPLASLGSFILMLGFLAFNGGCAKSVINNEHGGSVGMIFVNTIMASSGGAMMAVATDLLYAKVFCFPPELLIKIISTKIDKRTGHY